MPLLFQVLFTGFAPPAPTVVVPVVSSVPAPSITALPDQLKAVPAPMLDAPDRVREPEEMFRMSSPSPVMVRLLATCPPIVSETTFAPPVPLMIASLPALGVPRVQLPAVSHAPTSTFQRVAAEDRNEVEGAPYVGARLTSMGVVIANTPLAEAWVNGVKVCPPSVTKALISLNAAVPPRVSAPDTASTSY